MDDLAPSAAADTRHRTRAELDASLEHIAAAPKDGGALEMIVVRPAAGQRETPQSVELSAALGVAGDHWSRGCWLEDASGNPHPDVQVCMMSSRAIAAIAGPRENWAPAGDNLFLDLDLSPANMPPGTRFALGEAELVVTPEPHKGCDQFIARYGRDACVWVNVGRGLQMRLRGIYARVTKDGRVRVGDTVRKLP
ncbi:MOSC domain-containing protein [Pseudoroseicyclus tamaricis]|uniref:MOSC domain-containing protein n=1 Tax=Pseudoroseicyclus tamaricis TaxID=2705421 RepID=A0A6B2JFI4_9RHOB|nr:MOSC domain-containing protein [Pseudoroseicyclus tamaricis]NDU99800.1 MOSC domain-containing protein [Pseudoroseicyclus tamaricis]